MIVTLIISACVCNIYTKRERLRAGVLGYPNGDLQYAANLQAAQTVTAPPPQQLYTGNLLASKNPESDSEGLLDNPRPETRDQSTLPMCLCRVYEHWANMIRVYNICNLGEVWLPALTRGQPSHLEASSVSSHDSWWLPIVLTPEIQQFSSSSPCEWEYSKVQGRLEKGESYLNEEHEISLIYFWQPPCLGF